MRTITKTYNLYQYNELSDHAKKRVKNFFLSDGERNTTFQSNCEVLLEDMFPNSTLTPCYSLSSCQGDGFNIEGTVHFADVLPKLENFSECEITKLNSLFEHFSSFTFTKNQRYGYSCKFIDKRHINTAVNSAIEKMDGCSESDKLLIQKFYESMIQYFEELDKKLEKDGYEYLYEASEEETEDWCDANNFEFFEDGKIAFL